MLNDIIKKENDFAAGIISEYEKAIADTEKAISEVEEKYKKLAEEETKDLNGKLAGLKGRLNKWKDISNSAKDIIDVVEKWESIEEPEITDTVYPENNEQPCNSSDEPKNADEEEIPAEEFKDESAAAAVDGDDWGEPNDWN